MCSSSCEPGTSSDQIVCLTDLFATCAEIVGAEPLEDGAEDILSFLPALLGKSNSKGRTTLVLRPTARCRRQDGDRRHGRYGASSSRAGASR
jgi:hypothetical protein